MTLLGSAIVVGILIALVSVLIYRHSAKAKSVIVQRLGIASIYGLGGSFLLFYPIHTVV